MPAAARASFGLADGAWLLAANASWIGAWWIGALGYPQLVLLLALECLLARVLGLLWPAADRHPWWIDALVTLAQLLLLGVLVGFALLFAADAVRVHAATLQQQRTLAALAACLFAGGAGALASGAFLGDARGAFRRSSLTSAWAAYLTLATLPFCGAALWLVTGGLGRDLDAAEFETAMVVALFGLRFAYEIRGTRIPEARKLEALGLLPARGGRG